MTFFLRVALMSIHSSWYEKSKDKNCVWTIKAMQVYMPLNYGKRLAIRFPTYDIDHCQIYH